MNCPHCNKPINIGSLLGSVSSEAKAEAARANGAKGGRPPKIVTRRVKDENTPNRWIWEWSVPSRNLGGYCATKQDALKDAQIAVCGSSH